MLSAHFHRFAEFAANMLHYNVVAVGVWLVEFSILRENQIAKIFFKSK